MKILSIVLGVLMIFGGFTMMITPGITFLSVGWLIGFVFILSGINAIVDYLMHRKEGHITQWDLIAGILSAAMGILILSSPYVMILAKGAIIYFFNFWMIISGVLRIIAAVQMRKEGSRHWIWVMILAVLSVALGIYALFNILVMAVAIGWMMGFFVMMSGINLIGLGIPSDKGGSDAEL